MFLWWRNRRRAKLKQQAFPPAWETILRQNMPYYQHLSPDDQKLLQGHIQVFCAEKEFIGAQGLEITDEIRITIAAGACLLLLRNPGDYYPTLKTIIVYPKAYMAVTTEVLPGGFVEEKQQLRSGESWHRGQVVLSWDDARRGAADIRDGKNVIYHEFAHQLDSLYGPTDGVPGLEKHSMFGPWAKVLGEEYSRLVADVEAHRPSFIDSYGATNPAEFFAVITEIFFEKPKALHRHNSELYELLSAFYRQNPRNRY